MHRSTLLVRPGGFLPLAAVLVLGGCGGADDPVSPAPADFSGEYAYHLAASGGDCSSIPSPSGYGVTRVTQSGAAATMCWQSEECDGATCQSGTVEGNEFRFVVRRSVTDGACTYVRTTTFVSRQQSNGDLLGRGDTSYTYESGDCSSRRLPCSTWYTVVDEPCEPPCYDGICAGTSPAAASTRPPSGS